MGQLNHTSAKEVKDQAGTPVPLAKMAVFHAGSDRLALLYKDNNLTITQDNPVCADELGVLKDVFLIDGDYRIIIKDSYGKSLDDIDSIEVRSAPAIQPSVSMGTDFTFKTVSGLRADTTLSYTSGPGLDVVQAGTTVGVSDNRFHYNVADAAEAFPHLETAGGVKLFFVPVDGNITEAAAFGLVADTGEDQLSFVQKAIDFAAYNCGGTVVFPRGNIVIDGTLCVGRADAGLQAVKLQGATGSYIGNTRLIHGPTQTKNPLINIAGARMVEIADIELRGNNLAPTGQSTETGINATYADWVTPGCSDGRYSPYAGIALAALYGTDPGGAEGYDFDAYGQSGLPSKIFLNRVRIQNFVAGLVLAPNAGTPGVEDIMIRDSSLVENTFGICSTGTQQRNCVADNCNIIGHYCIIDGVTFGAQAGQPVNITNCNFGKSANVLQCSTDVGQNVISSTYFENVRGLGLIGTTPSGASHSALVQGCNLSLIGHSTATTTFNKDAITAVAMPTKVESCAVVGQTMLLLHANAPVRFENCLFRSMGAGSDAQEQFGIYASQGVKGQISVRGCAMRSYGGLTPLYLNDVEDVQSLPARALVSRNTYEIVDHGTRQRYGITPHPIDSRGPNVQNVTYVSADQISFDFTVQADRPILAGDLVFWRVMVPGKNDPEASTLMVPALRVSSVSGTNAICDILAHVDTSFLPTNIDILVPNFVNAVEATGDTTAGSPNITNVTNIGNFRVGDWIVTSDADLPQQIRIIDITGSTLVCHRTMNRTGNVSVFNSRLTAV